MASDELDEEERELLRKHREKRAQARAQEESSLRVSIWDESGAGAELTYAKAKKFLAKFGIDLDEEPVQDEESDDEEGKAEGKTPPAHMRNTRAVNFRGRAG